MKKHSASIIFIIICICLVPAAGLPCTTFVLDNSGHPVYGKNMDWAHIPAYVFINKRGVAKTSMILHQEPDAEINSWTSRFGSVTFNAIAREFPSDGINEAGLFISIMDGEGQQKDEYPEPDARAPFMGGQLVQYQLDNFSTVDEVIASYQSIRLARPPENSSTPQNAIHFLVADSRGKCASIEFIKGEMVCHTGWTMPVKALANSTYDHSIAYFRQYWFKNLFSPVPIPGDNRPSLLRFAVAADRVKKYWPLRSGTAIDYAFDIFQYVEMYPLQNSALWSSVYDNENRRIYFRSWNNDQIRWFDLSTLDFSCTSPVKVLDTSADLSGDVTNSFADYTKEIDLEMLKNWGFPQDAIDYLSSYPDTLLCTE